MNTTGLIAHWSMRGAHRDLAGRFRSVGNVRETLSRTLRGSDEGPEGAEARPLLVRQPGAPEWQPLLLAVREGDR